MTLTKDSYPLALASVPSRGVGGEAATSNTHGAVCLMIGSLVL
jgi:hypothetical protein